MRVLFDAELGCRYICLRLNFHTTPYSGFNSAFKAAYARVIPDPATRSTPVGRIGTQSRTSPTHPCQRPPVRGGLRFGEDAKQQ
eukprot:jgi/Tetstr1/454563/TSEL_041458.t1